MSLPCISYRGLDLFIRVVHASIFLPILPLSFADFVVPPISASSEIFVKRYVG